MKLPYSERELIDIISQALKDEAWEANRTGWYSKFSDESGLGEDAISSWVYKKNAPNLHNFLTAVANLGADFGNKIFAGTGYRLVPEGSDEIDAALVRAAAVEAVAGFDAVNAKLRAAVEGDGDKRQDGPSVAEAVERRA